MPQNSRETAPVHSTLVSQSSRMTVPVHSTLVSPVGVRLLQSTLINVTEQPDDCSSPQNVLQCQSQSSRMTVPVYSTLVSPEQPDDCSSSQNVLQFHRAAGWLFQSTECTLMSQSGRMTVPVHRTYFSVTEDPGDCSSPDDCSSPQNVLQCHRAAGGQFQSTVL